MADEMVRRMGMMEGRLASEQAIFDEKIPKLNEDVTKRPVVLYNVAHVGRSPNCNDPQNPALRILGVFAGGQEAAEHALILSRKFENLDYWITPLGEWLMMHIERMADQVLLSERIQLRLSKHLKRRERDFKQIQAARDKRIQSKTSYQKNERANRILENSSRENSSHENSVGEFSAKYMRINQRFAVISMLADTEQAVRLKRRPAEPLFRIYATFPSKKTATAYIKEELSVHVGNYDLDVVDMYEWLYPQAIDPDEIVEEYRNPEINSIMQHAKEEKKTTKQFRQRCSQLGKEPDMSYISGLMDTISEEPNLEEIKQNNQINNNQINNNQINNNLERIMEISEISEEINQINNNLEQIMEISKEIKKSNDAEEIQ
jgi:hypothetical protein